MANKTKELSAEKLQKRIMEKTMASISEASAATPSKKETKKTPKSAPVKEAKKETTKKEAQASKEKKASTTAVTREVKYVYPADCNDSLSRKKFRQQARASLKQFNTKLEKLDPKSKEYKQVAQELKDFQSQFLRG